MLVETLRQFVLLSKPCEVIFLSTITQSLSDLIQVDGALCAALVDAGSGMMLGSAGTGVNMEVASAGNTEVVRAKLKTIAALGLNDQIDDMLITLGRQYHIITLLRQKEGLFLYFVLDKAKSNLALARHKVQEVGQSIKI